MASLLNGGWVPKPFSPCTPDELELGLGSFREVLMAIALACDSILRLRTCSFTEGTNQKSACTKRRWRCSSRWLKQELKDEKGILMFGWQQS